MLSEFNIPELKEGQDLEVKLALGANGKGQLPKDFFPTYSAMANTVGGFIVLGVKDELGKDLAGCGN